MPQAPLPVPPNNRYYSLDIWRGIACLLVVVTHSWYIPAGRVYAFETDRFTAAAFRVIDSLWIGVPLFFVISGYCIAALCDTLRTRHVPPGQYFYRRFRRIFPPYWVALAALAVPLCVLAAAGRLHGGLTGVASFHNPLNYSWARWAGTLSLTETWRATLVGYRGDLRDTLLLGPAWTLCYEEQFYALCGLALIFAPRKFFPVLLGLSVAVIGVFAVDLAHSLPIAGFFFDGRWLVFAAGVLVYYRVRHAGRRAARGIDAGLALALIGAVLLAQGRENYPLDELCWGCGFALILVALYRWDERLYRAGALAGLRRCGVMCYSLYLVHWPIVKVLSRLCYRAGLTTPWRMLLVTVPLCLAAAVAAGALFFHLVERHFLNSSAGRTAARQKGAP